MDTVLLIEGDILEVTKYELARLIGARALQLAYGAPPLVKAGSGHNFISLAEEEFEKGVIPLVVLKETGLQQE